MKKQIKGAVVLIIAICIISFVLTACGGKSSLIGTWEVTEAEYGKSVGRQITFRDNGKMIDKREGYYLLSIIFDTFAEMTSWDIEDDTLILEDNRGNSYYCDWELKNGLLYIRVSGYEDWDYVMKKVK